MNYSTHKYISWMHLVACCMIMLKLHHALSFSGRAYICNEMFIGYLFPKLI